MLGVKRSIFFSSSNALVQRNTHFLRFTSSSTICGISLCTSGSPPAIDTIGAPHSSTAAMHSSTLKRLRRISSGCSILPHPAHARLHCSNGSSSSTRGYFFSPFIRLPAMYLATANFCCQGMLIGFVPSRLRLELSFDELGMTQSGAALGVTVVGEGHHGED